VIQDAVTHFAHNVETAAAMIVMDAASVLFFD
jgi:hypothetical protein